MNEKDTKKYSLIFQKLPFGLVFIFVVLLPLQAFLLTWIRFKFPFSSDTMFLFSLWKEYILGLLFVIIFFKVLLEKKAPFKITKLDKFILAFFILALFYFLFFGGNLAQKIAGLRYDLEFFLVYFLARSFNFSRRQVKAVFIAFFVVSVPLILFGLLQISYLKPSFMVNLGYSPNLGEYAKTGIISTYEAINPSLPNFYRIQSTFPGALQFSSYLMMILIFAFSTILFLRKKTANYLFPTLIVLGGFTALFATYSRSAWLGLFFAIFAIIFFYAKNKKTVLMSTIFAIEIAAIIIILFFNTKAFQTILLHGEIRENTLFGSTQTHGSAFFESIKLIAKNPLGLGIGVAGPASKFSATPIITENWYFQTAIEMGILGLSIFILINYYLFKYLSEIFKKAKDNFYKILSLGLIGSLVGIAVCNFFLHTWSDTATAYSFWLFAGLVVAGFESSSIQEESLNHSKNSLK